MFAFFWGHYQYQCILRPLSLELLSSAVYVTMCFDPVVWMIKMLPTGPCTVLKTIYFKISSAWHVTCSYNLKQALLKYCIPTWSKFTIYKKHNHNPFFVLLLLLKNILRWKHTLFKMRGRFWCHIYLYIYECIYHEAQNAVIITPPSRCKYMLTPSHSPAFCVMQTHTQAHKSQRKHSFPHTHT